MFKEFGSALYREIAIVLQLSCSSSRIERAAKLGLFSCLILSGCVSTFSSHQNVSGITSNTESEISTDRVTAVNLAVNRTANIKGELSKHTEAKQAEVSASQNFAKQNNTNQNNVSNVSQLGLRNPAKVNVTDSTNPTSMSNRREVEGELPTTISSGETKSLPEDSLIKDGLSPDGRDKVSNFSGVKLPAGEVASYICKLSDGSLAITTKGGGLFAERNNILVRLQSNVEGRPDLVICSDVGLFFRSSSSALEILDLSGNITKRREALPSRALSAAFDPQNSSILIGTADGSVYRWRYGVDLSSAEVRQGKDLERYIGHPSAVTSLVFHPFGRIFFSGSLIGELYVWRRYDADSAEGRFDTNILGAGAFVDNSTRIKASRGHKGDVASLSVSNNGELLAVGDGDGFIEVWKVRGMKLLTSIQAHRGAVFGVSFVGDANRLVSIGRDDEVKSWSLEEKVGNDPTLKEFTLKQGLQLFVEGVRGLYRLGENSSIVSTQNGDVRVINFGSAA